jgi:hypothetical protein
MTPHEWQPRGWRAFAGRRYRPFHGIAVGQALVGALACESLFVPFLLHLGTHPAMVMLVATLPIAGSASQALVPRMLRWTGGNLRTITLLATLAELRGLGYALVASGVALGAIDATSAFLVVLVIVGIGQTCGMVSGANLALWGRAVLSEQERRLVAPRSTALASALATVLLLPLGGILDAGTAAAGGWAYAALFLAGGVGGALVPLSARRLPRPGEVRVPGLDSPAAETPVAFQRFRRASVAGAFGMGVLPYLSVYAMAVLGLSAGFAVFLSGVGSAMALAASATVGTFLAEGSASRVLRASYVARVTAAVFAIAAFPGNPLAAAFLLAACALFNFGGQAGALASQERLFRIVPAGSAVACHASYVSGNALAATCGAALTTGVLLVFGPAVYLVHASLFAASGASRAVAAWHTEVGPTWRSQPAGSEAPAQA